VLPSFSDRRISRPSAYRREMTGDDLRVTIVRARLADAVLRRHKRARRENRAAHRQAN
jgi:hypothetical protein